MNRQIALRLLHCVALVSVFAGFAVTPSAPSLRTDSPPVTGLATLYYHDPLSHSMSFASGREGGMFQDHMVKNHGSDIDFGHYVSDAFTIGIEGGRRGAIIDLGSATDLKKQYGYSETVGSGQGFASIRLDGNGFVILKDYDRQTTQALQGTDSLLGPLDDHNVSVPVKNGHLYLMRLTDRHDPAFERIVKFQVVSYTPQESVTLRWYRMHG